MRPDKTPDQMDSLALVSPTEVFDTRSSVYAVLARGFSYPDETVTEFFSQAGRYEAKGNNRIARLLSALFQEACSTDPQEWRRAYLFLFDPINGPFPYEAEHRQVHDFSKTQIMADVMGFYRAFGVEPRNDRPDHLAAELEFMHLLTVKQSHALETGRPEKAAQCLDAQQKFFRDHLLIWTEPLLKAMRVRTGVASLVFYPHLMAILELFMQSEKERLT